MSSADIQTRDLFGELLYFDTLTAAFDYAKRNPSVWKISFNAQNGERVRLVKCVPPDVFIYEPLLQVD